ncbi:phnB-like protein [Methylophaga lonarensis MPL]|uniref:PhnB-like protein n=1 Tax=Methylophaga lonarensis MPL TaxID=1286106 RepID=M7NYH0_9GAMM|nr:YciI family protein [Methylophaga lonarensis]EMR13873.1 phnB-like protein [Methylophaga lonarensis MPL]
MKFIIIRKADANTEAGMPPSNEQLSQMADYNIELANAGMFISGDGLKPSQLGAKIQIRNGQPIVTDGPFTETKEVIAGFTMITANSRAEALDWAQRWPEQDVDLELRQVYELSDFAPGSGLSKHQQLADRLQKQPASTSSYLLFDGNCREAFAFYADVLGGEIVMQMTAAESPMADEMPTEFADKILHVSLQVGSWLLMGSDCPPGMYEKPQGFHVQIGFNDVSQGEQTFKKLAEGGEIIMPFAETFWAERFGMLRDRFGTPWMLNCAQCL